MKKIINFIRWFFGINLILASIGGFLTAEYVVAIFVLIFGLLLIPPIWNKIKNKPSSKLPSNSVVDHSAPQNFDRTNQFSYFPEDVQNAVKQVLETVNIMTTSKNIDTIQGRSDFLKERLQTLLTSSNSPRYETDLQKGLDFYKTLFYNTSVTQSQIEIITNPQNFSFENFYVDCLLNGYERFYEDQLNEIDNLKRADAKKRRFKNLVVKLEEVFEEINQINVEEPIKNRALKSLQNIGTDIEQKLNAVA